MHWLKTARRLEERRIACTHLARSAGLGSKAKNQWMPQEYEGVREVGRLGVSVLGDVREAESERTCRVGKPWSRSELDHRFDNCVMVKLNAPISSGLRGFIRDLIFPVILWTRLITARLITQRCRPQRYQNLGKRPAGRQKSKPLETPVKSLKLLSPHSRRKRNRQYKLSAPRPSYRRRSDDPKLKHSRN